MSKSTPSAIPGVSMMSDTLDFFKSMWENVPGMNLPGMKHIPGMVMPTLSIEEVEKQIKDLQAVESWLSLNLNMLRASIQGLEVQKATLSTLHTMGETFTAAIQAPAMPTSGEASAFHSPFTSPAASPAAAAHKPAAEDKPAAPDRASSRKKNAEEKNEASPIQPALDATAAMADAATAAMADAMQPLANPAAWWGMLQDQFKQAVDTAAAMTPDMSAAGATAKKSAAKSSSKSPAAAESHAESAARKRKPASKE